MEEVHDPIPCPVSTCHVEFGWPDEVNIHVQNEHSLEERRALIIGEITDEVKAGDAAIYTRNDLVKFFNWLTTNTDTFDRVMVEIEREHGESHTLDADLVEGLVEEFVKTIDKE